MSSSDGTMPHFSAFRPVNSSASSSSSKYGDIPIPTDIYPQDDQAKKAARLITSEEAPSYTSSKKVRYKWPLNSD